VSPVASTAIRDAQRLLAAGNPADCVAACRRLLDQEPGRWELLVLLGDAHRALGADGAALDAYRAAEQAVPGHALPYTRRICLECRLQLGPPPAGSPVSPAARRVQMTTLGENGRFGNQLLQYGVLALYGRRHGLTVEAPDWVGRYLYGCDDPYPSRTLPVLDERDQDLVSLLNLPAGQAPADRDLRGYFCGHTGVLAAHASAFRQLFQPVPAVQARLDAIAAHLRLSGHTLVAVHLRRGDFGHGRFWVAPAGWYLDWLDNLWPRLTRPMLYLATDELDAAGDFARFAPVLGAPLAGTAGLPDVVVDHWMLSRAPYLAISNSSFSFTAAMLNPDLKEAVRPDPDQRRMVPFDPWQAPVLLDPTPREGLLPAGEAALIRRIVAPGQVVVHAGQFCSDWTHLVRGSVAGVQVREMEGHDSLDGFRQRYGLTHIHHLRIGPECAPLGVLDGAVDTLGQDRIDAIHFSAGPGWPARLPVLLRQHGYIWLAVGAGGELRPIGAGETPPGASLALREQLLLPAGRSEG